MANLRAMVMLPMDSGGGPDTAVNNWHFVADPNVQATWDLIHAQLVTFYGAINSVMSSDINHASLEVRYYDLSQPVPRPPIYTKPASVTAYGTGLTLPHELAICLSYQGLRVAGTIQARRRGRVFLGPLNDSCNSFGLIAASKVTIVVNAAKALLTASNAAADWTWCAGGHHFEATGELVAVNNGWVDNAFDIQRRRGVKPAARTVLP